MGVLDGETPRRVVLLSYGGPPGASGSAEKKSGLAGLVARMLTESTKRRSAMALAEAVESLGTTLSAQATRDDSRVSLTVLPADFEAGLGLLAEVVTEPAFSERDFSRVQREWLDGLRAERQDPARLAMLAAVRALNGPVFGAPVNGTVADVGRLRVQDLRDFHARAYTPDNAALVVIGNIDSAKVESEARRLFGGLRGKSGIDAPQVPAERGVSATRVLVIDRPEAVQTAIAAVQPFPKRSEPGHEARELLGTVIGGLFTSRLNMNLREKHAYTYGAFARPVENRHLGTFIVGTNVQTPVTAAAIAEIRRELELVRDPQGAPVAPAELERARADLVHSLGATLEHPSRMAGIVASLFTDELPLDYYTRYPKTVAAVAPTEIQAAAERITPGRLLFVLVGDRQKIQPDLEKQGLTVEPAPAELLE
nr:MAG: hypothetical protein DIU78_14700 [Pseudomonadota bacterium]